MKNQNQTIVPYFMVLNAKQFIEFTGEVFNSKVIKIDRLEVADGVVHAEMKIGESIIYFADTSYDGSCGPGVCGELRNDGLVSIQMYIYVEDVADTYARAMKAGATSLMEITEGEHGSYMAGFVDPFGNLWWIQSKEFKV